jgi:hypothetical protein
MPQVNEIFYIEASKLTIEQQDLYSDILKILWTFIGI